MSQEKNRVSSPTSFNPTRPQYARPPAWFRYGVVAAATLILCSCRAAVPVQSTADNTHRSAPLANDPAEVVYVEDQAVQLASHVAARNDPAGTEVVTGGTVSTDQTTGDVVTVFNNGTIAAGSFVWLELTIVSSGADAPESFDATLTV